MLFRISFNVPHAIRGGYVMSIVYKCRHCGHVIGELKQSDAYRAQLGWDRLSDTDKADMIQHQTNGDIHIQAICESCETSLYKHPQYHELDFFIQ